MSQEMAFLRDCGEFFLGAALVRAGGTAQRVKQERQALAYMEQKQRAAAQAPEANGVGKKRR